MAEYLAGFSTVNITPPLSLGVRMGGYIRFHKVSRKVLDFLNARAVCFRHPTNPAESLLLISIDLVGFQYRLAKIIRQIISRHTGIPMARIILHFTHTHSSPDTIGIFFNHIHGLPKTDVQYPVVKSIMYFVIRAGTNAFKDATTPACIGFGTTAAPEPPIAYRRRPPYEKITTPVRFLKISDLHGNLLGVIMNYQAHPTQMPGQTATIHPEYPGSVAKALLASLPGLRFAAYFNGAAGDVTIYGYKADARTSNQEEALAREVRTNEELGARFVDLVVPALDDVATKPLTSIDVQRTFIFPKVGRVKPIVGRLKLYRGISAKSHVLLTEFKDRLRLLVLYSLASKTILNIIRNGRTKHHQTEVIVARINDITWFSTPGEPFLDYQDKIFDRLPNGKGIFSQMNETCGYIFSWSSYVLGGYEKFFSFDALFGRYLLDSLVSTLGKLDARSPLHG
jgi:hypothetical protein